jgi:hypothetical protein
VHSILRRQSSAFIVLCDVISVVTGVHGQPVHSIIRRYSSAFIVVGRKLQVSIGIRDGWIVNWYKSDYPRGMALATRMAAFQAEQSRETHGHSRVQNSVKDVP